VALKFEKGVLTSPGSTGNQTVVLADTGFGAVKAVILWGTYATSDGDVGADAIFTIGFGSYRGSTPQQWCVNHFADDAAATSIVASGQTSASILHGLNDGVTPVVDFDAALVSLDTAQFVINWTDLPATASVKFHYVALGGADITDALVDAMDITTGTGTQDETVVAGFGKPNLLFQTMGPAGTTEADTASHAPLMLGVGKSDSAQGVVSYLNEDARPSMELAAFSETDFIGFLSSDTALALNAVLSAVASWPTDGFQINKLSNAFGASVRMGYLALRGSFTSVIGSGVAPIAGTPPVTQDIAVGSTPRGGIFFHNVLPVTAGLDNTHADLNTFGIGATDGTHEGWAGVGDDDGAAAAVTHRHQSETKTVKMYTPSASGTLASEADGQISSNNIRLSWNDIDAVAREYRYVLFGDAVSGVYEINAEPASFAVVGSDAMLPAARLFDAGVGGYTFTGLAATLVHTTVGASELDCAPASFAVSGVAARIIRPKTYYGTPLTRGGSNPIIRNAVSAGQYDTVKVGPAQILKMGSTDYRMWYEAVEDDGTITTTVAYATSTDGTTWTKYGSNPLFDASQAWELDEEVSPNTVLWDPDAAVFKMWYHAESNAAGGERKIGYATSSDGLSWTKYVSNPVLGLGGSGAFDETSVHDVRVVRVNATDYRMWYMGRDSAGILNVGYATSADGISWTKYGGNPVFDLGAAAAWDDGRLMGFTVIALNDMTEFQAWYIGGNQPSGGIDAVGHARSEDGITWTRNPLNPVLSDVTGENITDTIHAYRDGAALDRIRVHYGHYDLTASPVLRGRGEAYVDPGILNAAASSYAVTGVDATFVKTNVYALSCDPGSYAVTAADATVASARFVNAATGTYTLTGVNADFAYVGAGAYILGADPRVFVVTGASATLEQVTPGAYNMEAVPGGYVLTGAAQTYFQTYVLNAAPAQILVSGADVTFRVSGREPNMDPIRTGWIATANAGGRIRRTGATA
jgi:hypothetical protein